MIHPKPESPEKEAFYGWLLGKQHNVEALPVLLKRFENFKNCGEATVPDVDFRMLTALNLSEAQWKDIARAASWNTLRMNINTFERHGCFADKKLVTELAKKLANTNEVRNALAFPYQLLTTFQNVGDNTPQAVRLALQDAMEVATDNVPALTGGVAVCVDTSGSMSSAATGNRGSVTTKTRCIDIAALVAATLARNNADCVVVPFDTCVHKLSLNPRDSVMTNASKLASLGGGGTACQVALQYLNKIKSTAQAVIYVSDNESWLRTSGYSSYCGSGTQMAQEWAEYRNRNKRAKLVCIDITPNTTTQVKSDSSVLNVAGFSDAVFTTIARFVSGDQRNFIQEIENFTIDSKA